MSEEYVSGITLLGGDPFEPENQKYLIHLLKDVKTEYPNKNVWCYTGYTFEQLIDDNCACRCEYTDTMIQLIDVLIDGRFDKSLKDLRCKWCGSTNQRVIDVQKTIKENKIVLYK